MVVFSADLLWITLQGPLVNSMTEPVMKIFCGMALCSNSFGDVEDNFFNFDLLLLILYNLII